jgi:hypothetical protein
VVDFYRHLEGEPLTAERFALLPVDDDRFSLSHLLGGAMVTVDRVLDQLALAACLAKALRSERG